MSQKPKQLDPELLEILRCPVAVHQKNGSDPGRLTVTHDGWWLVAEDSECKYPVIDGIPQMLPEIGKRYQKTAVADLPVPPPSIEELD